MLLSKRWATVNLIKNDSELLVGPPNYKPPDSLHLTHINGMMTDLSMCTIVHSYSCARYLVPKNPLFTKHPKALQLHVYLDEVDICNPVGSYSHKLVFMYFTFGDLELRYYRFPPPGCGKDVEGSKD